MKCFKKFIFWNQKFVFEKANFNIEFRPIGALVVQKKLEWCITLYHANKKERLGVAPIQSSVSLKYGFCEKIL